MQQDTLGQNMLNRFCILPVYDWSSSWTAFEETEPKSAPEASVVLLLCSQVLFLTLPHFANECI